jgi:hypothetical protein
MLSAIALAGTGFALAYSYISGPRNNIQVRSTLDNKVYYVQNLPDKQEACNLLAKIRQNLEQVIATFKDDNNHSDGAFQRLVKKFNPESFQENDISADSTSYSENKGEKIVVCLRDKTRHPYPLVDENTIMFVMIHECAHLMTESTGHTPEFWNNFRKLLQECIKCGVYQSTNYTKNPVEYCGMTISDTPL